MAIELAATRTKVLSPEQLLARLQQRLALLTSGARTLPERQRTLRAAIAWSYDLLEAAERRLLARLSVFSGGWTLASAEAVCDPQELGLDALEGLASLVDQSLVRQAEPGGGEVRSPCWRRSGSSGTSSCGPGGARPGPSAPRRALPRAGRGRRAPPHRRRPDRVAGPV